MNHPTDILEIEVDQDAVLMDIDTPEEYRIYRKLNKGLPLLIFYQDLLY
jgi:CTP:molybdopterin cytidylyltransferase MocA